MLYRGKEIRRLNFYTDIVVQNPIGKTSLLISSTRKAKSIVMKKYLYLYFLLCSFPSFSQPLRDINYEYLYNPNAQVLLQLKTVRESPTSYLILYSLQVKDTTRLMSEYTIEWEGRSMLSDKEGSPIALSNVTLTRHASGYEGRGSLEQSAAPRYLVAKVVHASARRAWIFYTSPEPGYPVNNYLVRNGSVVTQPFVHTNEKLQLGSDSEDWIVSYYNDNFPAAAPAFSEAQARVPRTMAVDSVFKSGSEMIFPMKGLYLIQKDTNAVEGLAFRSEEDYPQYSKVANLAGPLIYITTKQEYDRLEATQGNKKAFDRIILSIAMDTDRARTIMRTYFRRVELANRYFTSYKEGWKTDRGMIYIVFGMPEQVYRFADREVWTYKIQFDINFTFSRASSLFDPDNFVLIREKKYENEWYEVIDLWRNARF